MTNKVSAQHRLQVIDRLTRSLRLVLQRLNNPDLTVAIDIADMSLTFATASFRRLILASDVLPVQERYRAIVIQLLGLSEACQATARTLGISAVRKGIISQTEATKLLGLSPATVKRLLADPSPTLRLEESAGAVRRQLANILQLTSDGDKPDLFDPDAFNEAARTIYRELREK